MILLENVIFIIDILMTLMIIIVLMIITMIFTNKMLLIWCHTPTNSTILQIPLQKSQYYQPYSSNQQTNYDDHYVAKCIL